MSRIGEIREVVDKGKLTEPFDKKDLGEVFPVWPEGTRNAYLWKHYAGNPGRCREYFEKIALGKFRLKR